MFIKLLHSSPILTFLAPNICLHNFEVRLTSFYFLSITTTTIPTIPLPSFFLYLHLQTRACPPFLGCVPVSGAAVTSTCGACERTPWSTRWSASASAARPSGTARPACSPSRSTLTGRGTSGLPAARAAPPPWLPKAPPQRSGASPQARALDLAWAQAEGVAPQRTLWVPTEVPSEVPSEVPVLVPAEVPV